MAERRILDTQAYVPRWVHIRSYPAAKAVVPGSGGLRGKQDDAPSSQRGPKTRGTSWASLKEKLRWSPVTTAATSREPNCSWMAASRRCRLSRSGGVRKRKSSPRSQEHPMLGRNLLVWKAAIGALSVAASYGVAAAQGAPPPPAVSVTPVVSRQVTETIDYVGRLTAVDK